MLNELARLFSSNMQINPEPLTFLMKNRSRDLKVSAYRQIFLALYFYLSW